ncbi:unnamed protein product [Callosobruchus maculatus]|uniref:Uncharacterized protein n=1 Tax=Callosobruchus maculatus TaxID=64391 RepID=A0A653BUJ7_CALMS|nr:unnamed protein product [Callosobruchus maculatus]
MITNVSYYKYRIMGSCQIALFLAFTFIAIASVNCYKCYTCSTLNDKNCNKAQSATSATFDCDTVMKDNACVQISFVFRGTAGLARGCILGKATCDDVKKEVEAIPAQYKDCKICKDNLCNGAQAQ